MLLNRPVCRRVTPNLRATRPILPGAGLLALAALLILAPRAAAMRPEAMEAGFDSILARVVTDGKVDYASLKRNPVPLDQWLERAASLTWQEVHAWGARPQLAFYLNAYNARVLATVRDRYPIRRADSTSAPNTIRQIPGVWRLPFKVAGQTTSLEGIERDILLPEYPDPLIHFGLVRAAKGGPDLFPAAYHGETCYQQLEVSFKTFLTDTTRVRIDPAARLVRLSSLFDEYREDFATTPGRPAGVTPGPQGIGRGPGLHRPASPWSTRAVVPPGGELRGETDPIRLELERKVRRIAAMSTAYLIGASGALGSATARSFYQAGWKLGLGARSEAELADLREELRAITRGLFVRRAGADEPSPDLLTTRMDAGDPESVEAAFRNWESSLGIPDACLHVAGGYAGGKAAYQWSPAEWRAMIDLNLFGPALTLSRAFGRMVEAGRKGLLLAVGALAGADPVGGRAPYAASKAGLMHLVRCLAEEGKPHGIRANVIVPSILDTAGNRAAMPKADRTHWTPTDDRGGGHPLALLGGGADDFGVGHPDLRAPDPSANRAMRTAREREQTGIPRA